MSSKIYKSDEYFLEFFEHFDNINPRDKDYQSSLFLVGENLPILDEEKKDQIQSILEDKENISIALHYFLEDVWCEDESSIILKGPSPEGVISIDKDIVRKNYHLKEKEDIPLNIVEEVKEELRNEVEEYSAFITGLCFKLNLFDKNGIFVDTFSFLGRNIYFNGLVSFLEKYGIDDFSFVIDTANSFKEDKLGILSMSKFEDISLRAFQVEKMSKNFDLKQDGPLIELKVNSSLEFFDINTLSSDIKATALKYKEDKLLSEKILECLGGKIPEKNCFYNKLEEVVNTLG